MGAPEPVIVGVSQAANKDDERILHPVDLIELVVRQAFEDAGAGLAPHIGGVFASPLSVMGTENCAEMVGARLGLAPGLRIVDPGFSGTGPLTLLDQACCAIVDGTIEAALIVGGVADASVRRANARGETPPAPAGIPLWRSNRTPRPKPSKAAAVGAEQAAGVYSPVAFYALAESRMAVEAGRGPAEHRAFLSQRMARFSEVAASLPEVAWFPEVRTASDIATVHAGNRLVAEPYTKLMCSFPVVDLAGAVVVTSVSLADRLGVSPSKRVQPWGVVAAREPKPLAERPAMHRSVALETAVARLLDATGIEGADISAFDFYSCFPAAVELPARAFDMAAEDPRGLTCTGGMPYFGGPGASYGIHGVVSVAERCRAEPGCIAAAASVGGMMETFAAGLFSTADRSSPYRSQRCDDLIPRLEAAAVPVRREFEGSAVVHAMTVVHDRVHGAVGVPVIAELPDGSRIGARAADRELPAAVSDTSLIGEEVRLSTVGGKAVYELA